MDGEQKITSAQVAYRTVFLAAGLLLFGLLFRQLVTLLLAMLTTVVLAIPLAAAAKRLERFGLPRPGRRAARAGRRHRLARPPHLPPDPAVRRPDERVRGRRARDRRGPGEGLRRRHGAERRRGGQQRPAVRRALHRGSRSPDRAAHLDRPERGGHPRRAGPDPHHRLLHGDPARPARQRAPPARPAAAARAPPPRPRPHPQVVDRLDGGRGDRHARHRRDALRRAHDRGARLRDLLRRPVRAARGGALLRRDRRRHPADAVRAHRLARQGAARARRVHPRPAAREQRDDPGDHGPAREAAPGGDRHRRGRRRPAVRVRGPVRGRADPVADHHRRRGVLGEADRGGPRRATEDRRSSCPTPLERQLEPDEDEAPPLRPAS